MTNEAIAKRDGGPELPSPPRGEAAALVARLLSGCDQRVGVGAEAPPSTSSPEPAPVASELFTTECPAVAGLPADSKERAVPRPASARAPLPYANRAIWLEVLALTVLTFGAGLAVGYGILGRRFDGGRKATLQRGEPSAIRATMMSEDQGSLSKRADAPAATATANLPSADVASSAHGNAEALPKNGNDNDIQRPAQTRRGQSEQTLAISTPERVPGDSSVLDKSAASIEPDAGQRAKTAPQPVSTPSARWASTDGTTQRPDTSALDGRHDGPSIGSALSEDRRGAKAPEVAGTTVISGVDTGVSEAQVVPDRAPDEPSEPIAALSGHIDPCQLVHSVQPVYPDKAKELHIEGDVQLRVVVGVDGTVHSVGLMSGPPLLVMAAIDAAREFRYKPALLNGKPIETVQSVEMAFKLKN